MTLAIHDLRVGKATADELTLSYLLQSASSTFHQTEVVISSGRTTANTWSVPIADSFEDEEEEEREWHTIVSKPHVQQALRRMAAEARRQYYVGETEDGGFAVE